MKKRLLPLLLFIVFISTSCSSKTQVETTPSSENEVAVEQDYQVTNEITNIPSEPGIEDNKEVEDTDESNSADPEEDTALAYTEKDYERLFKEQIPSGQKIAKVLVGDFCGNGENQAFIITTDEDPDPNVYWDMDYGFMAIGIYYMDGKDVTVVVERNEEGSVNAEVGRTDAYDADIMIVQCLMEGYAADRNCDGLAYVVKDGEPVLAGRIDGYPSFSNGNIVGSHMVLAGEAGWEDHETIYDIEDGKLITVSSEILNDTEF